MGQWMEQAAESPKRIICLSDETSELLYLLGEQERISGVSGFCTRPPEVRRKPRISTFADADFAAIARLQPDLIIAYSDVQTEVMREAIARGYAVLNFNQRSVTEIFKFIATIARLVGQETKGRELIAGYERMLERVATVAERFPRRPRVFFEEWNEPIISGIRWVEELIEIAGGEVIFPEHREHTRAMDRVVSADEVARRNPEVILVSWCGKKADTQAVAARTGWADLAAVRNGHVYEIPSSCILQPGPACLSEGVLLIHRILAQVAGAESADI